MEENWEPFEKVTNDEGTTLRLHGTEGEREVAKEEDTEKILKAINNGWNVDIAYADIRGRVDIRFGGLEKKRDGKLVIEGEMSFYDTSFEEGVDFRGAIFRSGASFYEANFVEEASFRTAIFGGSVYREGPLLFEPTLVEGVDFCGTIFRGMADFDYARFKKAPCFNKTVFRELTTFNNASFEGTADFHTAIFWKQGWFSNVVFGGVADFSGTMFEGEASFSGSTFTSFAFFRAATFGERMDFEGVDMKYPANFSGVRIRENTVRKGLHNEILCRVKKTLEKKLVTDVYSINTGTVIDVSTDPYLKRYIDDEQWINSWRGGGGRGREALFLVWEGMSHCGRSIGLWTGWSLFFILLFSVIFTPSPHWWPDWWWGFWREHGVGTAFEQTAQAFDNQDMTFLDGFYLSIVSFTTLGFGDIIPANRLTRALLGLEVVLGYVMLGGLISIFANKLARRS